MKKFMIAAILMIATSGVLSAQNTKPGNGNQGTIKNATGFVDVNKNGVCDTYESGNRKAVKGSGQAPRLNKGQGAGYGRGNGQCGSSATRGLGTGNRGCRRAA
jgi:hypothetical protein